MQRSQGVMLNEAYNRACKVEIWSSTAAMWGSHRYPGVLTKARMFELLMVAGGRPQANP
jgi:hypothetical protein